MDALMDISYSPPSIPPPPPEIEKSGGWYCFLKILLIPPWKDEMEVSNCGKTGKHKSTQKPQACVLKGHWGLQVLQHLKLHSEQGERHSTKI